MQVPDKLLYPKPCMYLLYLIENPALFYGTKRHAPKKSDKYENAVKHPDTAYSAIDQNKHIHTLLQFFSQGSLYPPSLQTARKKKRKEKRDKSLHLRQLNAWDGCSLEISPCPRQQFTLFGWFQVQDFAKLQPLAPIKIFTTIFERFFFLKQFLQIIFGQIYAKIS